jgi:L-ascorbate metabolism protein UlaG (beta-lactamase superfamily)
MQLLTHSGGVRAMLADTLRSGSLGLAWLGQAGFAVAHATHLLLIDPYLSDSLATKYAGKEFPHTRMTPPPVAVAELTAVDAVLVTHRHGDHMDPGTLLPLAGASPGCRFIVPRAERAAAEEMGLPRERITAMDAGETVSLADRIAVAAIPSAHETVETNERGEHHFLGYILRLGHWAVYHSGDCVPYDGLAQRLGREAIDVALLPVNGRDEFRRCRGVPGNMSFAEAETLCRAAAIPWLVPHHFGMFSFNTVSAEELSESARRAPPGVQVAIPQVTTWFEAT